MGGSASGCTLMVSIPLRRAAAVSAALVAHTVPQMLFAHMTLAGTVDNYYMAGKVGGLAESRAALLLPCPLLQKYTFVLTKYFPGDKGVTQTCSGEFTLPSGTGDAVSRLGFRIW